MSRHGEKHPAGNTQQPAMAAHLGRGIDLAYLSDTWRNIQVGLSNMGECVAADKAILLALIRELS